MKGYRDGMQQAFDESELDAYYVGVGYGKKTSGDKHIGFNSDKERASFQKGVSRKDHHFVAYRSEPLTWWEKLFGVKPERSYDSRNRRSEARKRVKRTSRARKKNIKKQRRQKRKKK